MTIDEATFAYKSSDSYEKFFVDKLLAYGENNYVNAKLRLLILRNRIGSIPGYYYPNSSRIYQRFLEIFAGNATLSGPKLSINQCLQLACHGSQR